MPNIQETTPEDYGSDAEERLLLSPHRSDAENAREFAEHFGGSIRFALDFYLFDGKVWRRDQVGKVREIMLGCFEQVSKAKVDNALSLLKSVPGIPMEHSEFDSNSWHLGTPDGVLDLRSRERVAARASLVTKQTAVAPKEGEPKRWMRFLEEATGGDKELAAYLQKLAGYCLTGSIEEHALFFIFGPGGRGKSVFLETLKGMLGDYAIAIGVEALEEKSYRGIPADLARLRGVRLAIASETADGKAWDAQRMKALTGGDSIQARFLYGNYFEFKPSHKFVIAGNLQPYLKDAGEAESRRMHMIPFTKKPDKVNLKLAEELKEEWPQILSWALEGLRLWQQKGLTKPSAVSEALKSYMSEIAPFEEFFEERLVVEKDAFIGSRRAKQEFQEWWDSQDYDPNRKITSTWVGKELRKRGFEAGRTRDEQGRQLRGFKGVRPRRGHKLQVVDPDATFDPTVETLGAEEVVERL